MNLSDTSSLARAQQVPPDDRMQARPGALARQLSSIATGAGDLASYRQQVASCVRTELGLEAVSFQNTRLGASNFGGPVAHQDVEGIWASWAARREPFAARALMIGERPGVLAGCCTPDATVAILGVGALGASGLAELELALPVHILAEVMWLRQSQEPFAHWAERAMLTPRQREVAGLAIRGLTNPEIGRTLHCSSLTVRSHLVAVFQKCGVASRAELIYQALACSSSAPAQPRLA